MEGDRIVVRERRRYIDLTGRFEGPEAIRGCYELAGKIFPDDIVEISRVIEEGDTVVLEWRERGTNTGALPMPDGTELPATGKTVEMTGATVSTIRAGKYSALNAYYDSADVMRQLGLMPG